MPLGVKAIQQATERTMSLPDVILHNRLIDLKELRKLVSLSPSSIYRLEKAGQFPKRIKVAPGRVAWHYAEVADWIETKKQGRVWKSHRSSDEAAYA